MPLYLLQVLGSLGLRGQALCGLPAHEAALEAPTALRPLVAGLRLVQGLRCILQA